MILALAYGMDKGIMASCDVLTQGEPAESEASEAAMEAERKPEKQAGRDAHVSLQW
jgi:hypothetical protein